MKSLYKKTKKICSATLTLCFALVTCSLVSCSDYLTVPSESSINPQSFYSSEAQADQAIMGIYYQLYSLPDDLFRLNEIRSDNIYMAYYNDNDGSTDAMGKIAYFKTSPSGVGDNAWSTCGNVLAAANMYLDNEEKVPWKSEDNRIKYKAQARFLRGMIYFYFVRWFGNVPETMHLLSSNAMKLPLTGAAQIYNDIIIPDLEYAVENLEAKKTSTDYGGDEINGRASKYTAEAFLGEAYMTMCGYPFNNAEYDWKGTTPWTDKMSSYKQRAMELFQDVIDFNNANDNCWWAEDMSTWHKMWLHENDNTKFMFEIECATDEDGADAGNGITALSVPKTFCTRFGGSNNQVSNYSVRTSPDLTEHFLQRNKTTGVYVDQRAFSTVMVQNYSSSWSGYLTDKYTYTYQSSDNVFFSKFWENSLKRDSLLGANNTWAAKDCSDNVKIWPQDFPLMRYENVILLMAELKGYTSEGLQLLNMTRTRAGLEAYTMQDFTDAANVSSDPDFKPKYSFDGSTPEERYEDAVLTERQYELAEEGERWFDLVRTDTYTKKCSAMLERAIEVRGEDSEPWVNALDRLQNYDKKGIHYFYIFPIPQSQIEKVGTVTYPQNPGYEAE